jgi:hypothetical protein
MIQDRKSLLHFEEAYIAPDHNDVKKIRELLGLNAVQLTTLMGFKVGKNGSNPVSCWEADPLLTKSARDIPFSAWQMMLIYAGVITPLLLNNNLEKVKARRYSDICKNKKVDFDNFNV